MSGILQGLVASLGGEIVELDDVFNVTAYTGSGLARTITTDIDTLNEGGLIWLKDVGTDPSNFGHKLFDTIRGGTYLNNSLDTSRTVAQISENFGSFNDDGFYLGGGLTYNATGIDYVAWTFRKAPKFFDVVTYTGTGSTQTIAHNLNSVPGVVIVKKTGGAGNWRVYHRGLTSAAYTVSLNSTAVESSQPSIWNSTAPTGSVFTVGTDIDVNETGQTYVAYVFAHEAGGLGVSRTQNATSCGSYTGTGSTLTVDCGFATSARFVMIKRTDSTGNWFMWDSARGIVAGNDPYLLANTSAAQVTATDDIDTFSTGFELPASSAVNASAATYIYLAIA
jgi:hypothetical protein